MRNDIFCMVYVPSTKTMNIPFIANFLVVLLKDCVSQLVNYAAQRGNPFNTENHWIQNLATGSKNDKNVSKF